MLLKSEQAVNKNIAEIRNGLIQIGLFISGYFLFHYPGTRMDNVLPN
jgi:hypothetical protein